ncbi:BOLA class I histocompatibility antigen, alpha chain BL3-7-like isoform X2 [Silurus meridionalis]|uniref:BOLA class I histocompatibility antigen, alpha chain BL3-7-like isoform X2 n=1 Tax=Silurus meridionalis TaxID=175797 RepID=UPI001EE9EF95|nr:BOLA class I histocompatibility antigen, alpha chain BL3-7-like isoform X2 [Silurus meridionalis]
MTLWRPLMGEAGRRDPHSLQYLHTGLPPGTHFPEFTAVGLFDGQQFVYYDSNISRMIPKTQWIQKISADYWDRETQKQYANQEVFIFYLDVIKQEFNQTEGVHTLQRMYGCEIDGNGTTRGYDQYGYDGEDFFSLDLNTGSWTAVNDEVEIFINRWDPVRSEAEYWRNFLETECINWMKKFVSYSRETLERKIPPAASVLQKHSSSPEVVCHATGFFPKALIIKWQKDGVDVYKDVDLRETLPNQDGSFQKRSILKVSAKALQKHTYTCVIEHSSLEKEMVLKVPKDGGSDGGLIVIEIIVGVVVSLLFLVAVVAGIVVWKNKNFGKKRKKTGFKPVPPRPSSEGGSFSINLLKCESVCSCCSERKLQPAVRR